MFLNGSYWIPCITSNQLWKDRKSRKKLSPCERNFRRQMASPKSQFQQFNCILQNTLEFHYDKQLPQITRFMGPTSGPPGFCRPQMCPMLAPWTCYQDCVSTHCDCLLAMVHPRQWAGKHALHYCMRVLVAGGSLRISCSRIYISEDLHRNYWSSCEPFTDTNA